MQVAVREITHPTLTGTATLGGRSGNHTETWDIDGDFLPNKREQNGKDRIRPIWRARRELEFHEVSFMDMGETFWSLAWVVAARAALKFVY